MYNFSGKHFIEENNIIIFKPQVNLNDYEITQSIYEAERNIGALARLGLKNHPLKPTILRNSIVRTAHFTTKIEQNKLEYKEVEVLFDNFKRAKLSVKEKAKIEVTNVFDTYNYINQLSPEKDFADMDEQVLIEIHTRLMNGLSDHPIGYRTIPVSLKDGDGTISYVPPAFNEAPKYMSAYLRWLFTATTGLDNPYSDESDLSKKVHPLLISAITHHLIGYIHPFADGNGRTARAYSTLVGLIHRDLAQIKDAFAVEEFIDKEIEDYYDSLMEATQGNLRSCVLFYLKCVNLSLAKVLQELQRYDKIKHIRDLLGQSNARTMFEMIVQLKDRDIVHRHYFDSSLPASKDTITKNLKRLKELGVIQQGDKRGEYIVSIGE